ncbi:MAG: hypothetical protein HQL21_08230 [Candidatus Omnitrophica bacterium]|nr:hypothetical protein [Candidatus Omnitrophota bacterium]
MIDRIKRLGRFFYFKLFRINDTPLKIALGFGLGAFVEVRAVYFERYGWGS